MAQTDEDDQVLRDPGHRLRGIAAAVGTALVLLAVGAVALFWWQTRLTFPYEAIGEPVEPGQQVEIRAPDEACGPLIVTLNSPSVLGMWNQTHSGNAIDDSFTRDEHVWWSLFSSRSTFTPVPCRIGGAITLTIPDDVTASVIAACDQDNHCAKVHVAQPHGG